MGNLARLKTRRNIVVLLRLQFDVTNGTLVVLALLHFETGLILKMEQNSSVNVTSFFLFFFFVFFLKFFFPPSLLIVSRPGPMERSFDKNYLKCRVCRDLVKTNFMKIGDIDTKDT